MSIKSAQLFFERIKTDEDFAEKVENCKDAQARMEFVKAEGFDFTPIEIKSVSEELSDRELDAIAGGDGRRGGSRNTCNTVGGTGNPQYQPM